ncbi:tRNA (5-methylaminomethyl-2-thiouridine)(34)-methyltransferase MnmD [Rhizobium halophytocola]|uniref:tRNA U34 5-methylaminomethyl-2-thiouridine-forming methyltransferase MnmC n=1 Tax=Rhizobium halophytocola TaxID=735519 RepID=A0ABS4DSD6_9HYPH|nr:tRNA (5-methylaminomethyl-2-thiouridine)(34)-methyltransferase MnmD [Rhizobium halophytocola]MBP1848612.1 tRNA U34 5-methylaminomethyl-2-thiouridine-forming methyltransferase MnmC [Rhizobium halophytocola]
MTTHHSHAADQETEKSLVWHEGDMPYSTAFGDHFYSQADGRLECAYVFLAGNGLPERWQAGDDVRIGELGFGTGLNLCETWRQWAATRPASGHLHFVSFELYPMQREEIDRALGRWPEIAAQRLALTALWPDSPGGTIELDLDGRTRLTVVCGEALESVLKSTLEFDAWYLDGFAPSRNGAMWSPELMQALHAHTVPGGRFATYAAAGFVRRNLQAAGFDVERRPGFAGKREMLAGSRPRS